MSTENSGRDILMWEAIKSGKSSAFGLLYQQYAELLFAFGMGYSNDRDFIKDCIHDLFTDLYRYRNNLAEPENLKNYLIVSLRRRMLKNKSDKLSIQYFADLVAGNNEVSESAEKTMIDEEEYSETNRLLLEAIKKLPDKQKEALHLKYSCDLSYPEISEIMDISVESVRTQVYRAIKALKQELKSSNIILLSFLFSGTRNR